MATSNLILDQHGQPAELPEPRREYLLEFYAYETIGVPAATVAEWARWEGLTLQEYCQKHGYSPERGSSTPSI